MRILFVGRSDKSLSLKLPWFRLLRERGHQVHLSGEATGTQEEALRAEGFPFNAIGPDLYFGVLSIVQPCEPGPLLRVMEACDPQVVHVYGNERVLLANLAARARPIPLLLSTWRGMNTRFDFLLRGERDPLNESHLHDALSFERHHVIFQNPSDRDTFVSAGLLPAARAHLVLSSGVDPARFPPRPEPAGPPWVVTMATRMLWRKGAADLVNAAYLLRQQGLDLRVQLVGAPGPIEDTIPTDQLQAWHDHGLVRWLGHREDVPELLAASHVVALPSYYTEGLPRSLAEGALTGRALLTTDTPGCREVVHHGENGLLVPPRDPYALAEALRTLITDHALRQRMGQRSLALGQRFTMERVIEQYDRLYRELSPGA